MTTPKGARHLAAMYENFSGSNPTSAALIDLANQVERLEAQRKELREALKEIINDRDDQCFKPEEFVTTQDFGSYWSPHASMVRSECIAKARAALKATE